MQLKDLRKLHIRHFPDPILSKAAAPVELFDERLRDLAHRMVELMHEAKGVGLAAPQVGLGLRLFVCNPTGEDKDDMAFVNPRFTDLVGNEEREEGCLSIPGVTVNVRRATEVTMQAVDLQGQAVQLQGTNLLARIWQHEVDHLDGRLIIDRMSASDEIANRKVLKQLKDQYRTK
jgi:peptide deformylase